MEARFARAGHFVAQRLPANALVITDYESGSVPFYSGRPTLAGAPGSDVAGSGDRFVEDRGFEPYLLFERWEETAVSRQVCGQSDRRARLARRWPRWPPGEYLSCRDRDRYRAGVQLSDGVHAR